MPWTPGTSGNPSGKPRRSKEDPLTAALRKYLSAAPSKLQIDPAKDSTAVCVAKRLLQKAALGDARSTERILEHSAASQAGGETYTLPGVPGDESGLVEMIEKIYGIRIGRNGEPEEKPKSLALKESGS